MIYIVNKKYYLLLEKILGKNQQIILNKFTKKNTFCIWLFFKHTFKTFLTLLMNFQIKNFDVNLSLIKQKR